jgi:hypothetical protein
MWLCYGYTMVILWLYYGYTMVTRYVCHSFFLYSINKNVICFTKQRDLTGNEWRGCYQITACFRFGSSCIPTNSLHPDLSNRRLLFYLLSLAWECFIFLRTQYVYIIIIYIYNIYITISILYIYINIYIIIYYILCMSLSIYI